MTISESGLEGVDILYLEDEVLISYDVSAFLEDLGFGTVTSVQKLEDAWNAVENGDYDIALLDINVDRKQTSIDLGRHLCNSGTVVVFASGNTGDAEQLRKDGCMFLDKPFSHRSLEAQIRAALENRHATAGASH